MYFKTYFKAKIILMFVVIICFEINLTTDCYSQVTKTAQSSITYKDNKSIQIGENRIPIKYSDIPFYMVPERFPIKSQVNIYITKNYLGILKKLGYYKTVFRDISLNQRSAIIHFQSDNNLKTTGKMDSESIEALKNKIFFPRLGYTDYVKNPPVSGQWITINKTKTILTLYNGKKVVRKYPVAIGNPPSLTPTGKFRTVNRIINPAWGGGGYAKPVRGGSPRNPLGYRWMGLSLEGGSEYGIHGNTNPYSIGTYASHGCIRMFNLDVEEIFEKVKVGTQVWIATDAELKKWGVIQGG